MKSLIVIAALFASTSVYAQEADSRAIGVGTGIAHSHSISGAQSISRGGNGGSARQAAFNGGNSINVAAPKSFQPIGTAFAPGLAAAGIESCNNSVSLGAGFPGGGASVGFPVADNPCNRRLGARTLWAFGRKDAAIQMLCLDSDLATALVASGDVCRIGPNAPQVANLPASPSIPLPGPSATAGGDSIYVNSKGQRFREVQCGTPGARKSADPGVCVRMLAAN